MGADFSDEWQSDNKDKAVKATENTIKMPNKHQLILAKEKRRGKVVSIVQPFYLPKEDLNILVKTLKKTLGTGGTIKENRLEFQGEVREKLKEKLIKLDYRFKN